MPCMTPEDEKSGDIGKVLEAFAAALDQWRVAGVPDGELDGLRENFLTRDNMKELELDAVDPITWFRLTFGGFSRIGALGQEDRGEPGLAIHWRKDTAGRGGREARSRAPLPGQVLAI